MTGQSIRYRGTARAATPLALPLIRGGRPRKRWTYIGLYGPELMLCAARVEIGPVHQAFWAVWDRGAWRLHERTLFTRSGRVNVDAERLRVRDRGAELALDLEPTGRPVEALCPAGDQLTWTRKTPLRARGRVRVDGRARQVRLEGILDESAGHHARHTAWRWSAGVGRADDGRAVAWNLVAGLNDPPVGSERAVWVAGEPAEPPPVDFDDDLGGVRFGGGPALAFSTEATRRRHDELLVAASDYTQPFGRFTGDLPGGVRLAEGWGVMERHVARW